MSKKLIICEKPNQSRIWIEVFKNENFKKHKGYYEGNNYIITYCFGHLLNLKDTDDVWSLNNLPILFEETNDVIKYYTYNENTKEQIQIIKKLFENYEYNEIICAADFDVEGAVIYRNILSYMKITGIKESRCRIKDNNKAAYEKNYETREEIHKSEGLEFRGYGRALADYTYGINLTQALTLKTGILSSVGRVQTPTLKMIVDRYNLSQGHIKELKYRLNSILSDSDGTPLLIFNNKALNEKKKEYLVDKLEELNNRSIKLDVNVNLKKIKSPGLYNLIDIQKWANEKHKYSASKTLSIIQSLYEKGYVSYPRTNCKNITQETANGLNQLLTNNTKSINSHCIGEVTAHDAIVPTKILSSKLSEEEENIYNEIFKKTKSNYYPDVELKEVILSYENNESVFQSKIYQKANENENWFNIYQNKNVPKIIEEDKLNKIRKLISNDIIIKSYNSISKSSEIKVYENKFNLFITSYETKPPKLFTESTLLSKMENIHKDIDDEDNKKIIGQMKGIGTDATRGDIIKNLHQKKYVVTEKNYIVPTKLGIELISKLTEIGCKLLDLEFVANIEKALLDLEENKNLPLFIKAINRSVNIELTKIVNADIKNEKILGFCPNCKNNIIKIKTKDKKILYICENKECDFIIGNFFNLDEEEVKLMLTGGKSNVKEQTSKNGKKYKCYYFLNGNEICSEFVNNTKGKKWKKRKKK